MNKFIFPILMILIFSVSSSYGVSWKKIRSGKKVHSVSESKKQQVKQKASGGKSGFFVANFLKKLRDTFYGKKSGKRDEQVVGAGTKNFGGAMIKDEGDAALSKASLAAKDSSFGRVWKLSEKEEQDVVDFIKEFSTKTSAYKLKLAEDMASSAKIDDLDTLKIILKNNPEYSDKAKGILKRRIEELEGQKKILGGIKERIEKTKFEDISKLEKQLDDIKDKGAFSLELKRILKSRIRDLMVKNIDELKEGDIKKQIDSIDSDLRVAGYERKKIHEKIVANEAERNRVIGEQAGLDKKSDEKLIKDLETKHNKLLDELEDMTYKLREKDKELSNLKSQRRIFYWKLGDIAENEIKSPEKVEDTVENKIKSPKKREAWGLKRKKSELAKEAEKVKSFQEQGLFDL